MVQPGTLVTPVGSDQFIMKGLTEVSSSIFKHLLNAKSWLQDGRSDKLRDYSLRAPSTALRDDWVIMCPVLCALIVG